jgi:hypothetical protein
MMFGMAEAAPIQVKPAERPCRVGIIVADRGKINRNALKYLVLHLNCLQRKIEFEFLPEFDDPFLRLMESGKVVNRDQAAIEAALFVDRCSEHLSSLGRAYQLPGDGCVPGNFIVVTLATFHNRHYGLNGERFALMALGDWEKSMAPPSIIEMILTLVLRQAVGFLSPAFMRSRHLGTKGCLFDFTSNLADVKFKTLQGFICSDCRGVLASEGHPDLADSLEVALNRRWIRRRSLPGSPASIVSKFGYDLFVTKGLQPTMFEALFSALRRDGVKELLKIASNLLLAALLLWLGLKK